MSAIALYFGSFNPIHIGHLIIAQHALNYAPIDKVWLVISPHNPFKSPSDLLRVEDRLVLVERAIEATSNIAICTAELDLPRPSYTIDTLRYLAQQYPEHQFSLLFGSDTFLSLPQWKEGHTLLHYPSIYVYERPHYPLETIADNVHLFSDPSPPLIHLSSSYIRAQLRMQHSITYLVPISVEQKIIKEQYYL